MEISGSGAMSYGLHHGVFVHMCVCVPETRSKGVSSIYVHGCEHARVCVYLPVRLNGGFQFGVINSSAASH